MLARRLEGLDDEQGARVPEGLPPVVDAHVHLFPDQVTDRLWAWFEEHGWPIRYRMSAPRVVEFLLSRGVSHVVGLVYAHRAGMADALNAYVAAIAGKDPRVTGLATVLPGEEGATTILEAGFDMGLRGVKFHAHVQCVAADDARLDDVYALCSERGLPVVFHAGREPKSPAYRCDPWQLCSADRVERVLRRFPTLKLVVPHLGADELSAYRMLLGHYDNLWLDTTMAIAGYLPGADAEPLTSYRPERLIYGSDFPNLPYAWDRELGIARDAGLDEQALTAFLGGNARALFGIAEQQVA
ncbi:MAG: amidohydrolase [Deltaproteobacteria bacterium]|nr:amidohydrolase [Deltaproteobacteria bacterium]